MESKYSNHDIAIGEIAEKLGLSRSQVSYVITSVLFRNLHWHIKFPNIVRLPYIGRLVPDMRRYRHIEKRRQKISKLIQKLR